MVFKNKKKPQKKQIQPCPYSHNYPRDNPGYHLAGPPAFEAFPPASRKSSRLVSGLDGPHSPPGRAVMRARRLLCRQVG